MVVVGSERVRKKKESCVCPQGVKVVRENRSLPVVCCRTRDKTGN